MKKRRVKRIFIILFIIAVPFIIIGFSDRYFSERTGIFIKERAQMYSMQIISDTINEEVSPNLTMNDILIMEKDNTGKVNSVLINTAQVNRILGVVAKSVERGVKELEQADKITSLSIPLGVLISSTIFANKGPRVEIKIRPIGSYKVDLVSEVSGYGINNSLVLVSTNVKIEIEALIPLRIVPVTTESKIILVSQIIKGEIPRYYYAAGTYLPNPPPEANFGNVPGD